jgi:hypothetical protein
VADRERFRYPATRSSRQDLYCHVELNSDVQRGPLMTSTHSHVPDNCLLSYGGSTELSFDVG